MAEETLIPHFDTLTSNQTRHGIWVYYYLNGIIINNDCESVHFKPPDHLRVKMMCTGWELLLS